MSENRSSVKTSKHEERYVNVYKNLATFRKLSKSCFYRNLVTARYSIDNTLVSWAYWTESPLSQTLNDSFLLLLILLLFSHGYYKIKQSVNIFRINVKREQAFRSSSSLPIWPAVTTGLVQNENSDQMLLTLTLIRAFIICI